MSQAPEQRHLSPDEADAVLAGLEDEERALSSQRARLHDRIDFARQLAVNDAISADRLERLLTEERELGLRRRALHTQIEQVKAARRLAS
jgi:hypothetical protein